MLTFPEEVVVLLLDEEEGTFLPVAKSTLELAMSGSVLMELAMVNRIDTDLERLAVIDPAPTGNVLFDNVLKRIADREETKDVRDWFKTLSEEETTAIQEQALASLVGHGILKREQKQLLPEIFRHLCIFRSPRYFSTDPTPAGRTGRAMPISADPVRIIADSPLNPFVKSLEIPDIISIINRAGVLGSIHQRQRMIEDCLADLYLRPPLGEFKILGFSIADKAREIGYAYGVREIGAWAKHRRRGSPEPTTPTGAGDS